MSSTFWGPSKSTAVAIASLTVFCLALMWSVPAASTAAKNGPILFSDYSTIWKVQPDGTKLKKIAKRPAWTLDVSPNGRTLIYTHDGLFKMPVSGGRKSNLLKRYPIVSRFAGINWARWSPNGKTIVFAGQNDGRIYTIKANGKGLRYLLGKNRTGVSHPVYSPNGREIAFLDTWNDSSLMAVNVKSHKERRIYSGSGPAGTPTDFDWHPSGTRLAFYAPYRNWMIDSDGSDLHLISPDSAFASYENMSFSPDGSELLGRSVAPGGSTSEIWRMDGALGAATGGYAEMVTGSFAGSAFFPEWAPRPRRAPKRH